MPNSYFQFKEFIVEQDQCAMKVTTDACLFGAWVAEKCHNNFPERKITTGEPGFETSSAQAKSIKDSVSENESASILDIGTGSGLLALMSAQQFNGRIDAIEIDENACSQADANFKASAWANRLMVFQGDVRQFIFKKKYDIIVSNPPFYENELASRDQLRNLAMHGGLSLQDLMKIIKENLRPDGSFFLLLPFKRQEEIRMLLSRNEFQIQELCFVRQSARHDYFRVMLMGKMDAKLSQMTEIEEIAIVDELNKYTPEFTRLLKDYYLNL